ncbi:MAG TPA: DUF1587 domain-containing protein [Bryobacteraceae bacterium]|nr:DUF1587 domain-containing protein [Bryobacteraceae bacterium]
MATARRLLVSTAGVLLFGFPAWPQGNPAAAMVTQYCTACHNAKLKTAGLVLDGGAAAEPAANAELWEKVIQKLRAREMPPAGMRRPGDAEYDAAVSFLETALDRAAAAHPNPGRLPLLHRLSRTEYGNAIRDLLALDALPKEMDWSTLLPADNESSGFDNLADLLFVSPSDMESYLNAARKISRLAVGDPAMPVMVNRYPLAEEEPQDAQLEELPFGTRGGLAVRSDFPLDGEYRIKVEPAGEARERQQLEILVDGARVGGAVFGGEAGGQAKRTATPLEFRVPLDAGPHLVGVTFVEENTLEDELATSGGGGRYRTAFAFL